MVQDMNIKNKLIFFALLFFSSISCNSQKSILKKDVFRSTLKKVNTEMYELYKSRDSIFQKKTAYSLARIIGARERFIMRPYLYVDYLNGENKLEIYDVSSNENFTKGVNSFIYFNDRLVIYYSDMSSDTYKIICDACELNPKQLDINKYLVVHTIVNEENDVIIDILE